MRIGTGGTPLVDVTDELTRLVGTTRDWWLNEIRAGRAFSAGAAVGPSVGNYSEVQLFNPAASGVTLLVRRIIASAGAASNSEVRTFNTALATLARNGVALLAGGAAGLGALRTATPAAQNGTYVRAMPLLAVTPTEIARDWDFELGAGEGILVAVTSTNVEVNAVFWWVEV